MPWKRCKNNQWNVWVADDNTVSFDGIKVSVLCDIRDELQTMNAHLSQIRRIIECPNTTRIPSLINRIAKNTTKKRKPKIKSASSA